MADAHLERARDHLEAAADKADDGDRIDRIETLVWILDSMDESGRSPDHGKLARFENALVEIRDGASDEVIEAVGDAHDELKEYRSGIEGV